MASGTATAPSSGWEEVLLDAHAFIGKKSNATTAGDLTRNKERIEVSFCPAQAPLPSRLYVHCPDLDSGSFSEIPRILCMVDGIILIRVAIRCRQPGCILKKECDYFIYRVDIPSLKRLPHPDPILFQDDDVGLLPRGDSCTVAALVATDKPTVFTLHLFRSEIGSWTSIAVSLVAPQKDFPVQIPSNASRLFHHWTNTVITLGGKDGTMGWVDLWRGILLCDVLSQDPKLRGVPVPLPQAQLKCNDGMGVHLGCPEPCRGIAFIKGKGGNGYLRFVDLGVRSTRLPGLDKETGKISVRFDVWSVTTWSNYKMTDSFDDWVMDRQPVHAKNMSCSRKIHNLLQKYEMLWPEMNVQNLCVSHPTPRMGGGNVVYMMTRAKFMHPKACVLAVDMEKIKLEDVVEFGTEREPGEGVICRHGSVSKLLMNRAASQVTSGNLRVPRN